MRVRDLVGIGVACTIALASSVALAEGDVKKGKKVFNKCKACHLIKDGKKSRGTGPNLFGVIGRKAAALDDFKYSSAMKESGLTWDEATLDKYLTKPKKLVPKTKMAFVGLKKEADRVNVIAYIMDMSK